MSISVNARRRTSPARRRDRRGAAREHRRSRRRLADPPAAATGQLPRLGPVVRADFQRVVAEQQDIVATEWGLALGERLHHHQLRELGRVAAQRAFQLCHILTIEGREYLQCLPVESA